MIPRLLTSGTLYRNVIIVTITIVIVIVTAISPQVVGEDFLFEVLLLLAAGYLRRPQNRDRLRQPQVFRPGSPAVPAKLVQPLVHPQDALAPVELGPQQRQRLGLLRLSVLLLLLHFHFLFIQFDLLRRI